MIKLFKYTTFRIIAIILAAVLMAFTINNFVHIGGLLPGGFTGITLLLQKLFLTFCNIAVPYSVINIPLNAIPAIISYRFIGKKFTLLSCLMIILTGVFIDIMPTIGFTSDILLCAIFGGILNAVAISICLLSGATSGGTDFISIFISEHYDIDAWNYIFLLNAVILTISGVLFGLESAMYSIILQFVSTSIIGQLYKRYQKQTLFIITDKVQEVYNTIRENTNHDGTLFKGVGLYHGKERSMIYSIISSDELRRVVSRIKDVDSDAFINIVKSEQIMGNFYKRPND